MRKYIHTPECTPMSRSLPGVREEGRGSPNQERSGSSYHSEDGIDWWCLWVLCWAHVLCTNTSASHSAARRRRPSEEIVGYRDGGGRWRMGGRREEQTRCGRCGVLSAEKEVTALRCKVTGNERKGASVYGERVEEKERRRDREMRWWEGVRCEEWSGLKCLMNSIISFHTTLCWSLFSSFEVNSFSLFIPIKELVSMTSFNSKHTKIYIKNTRKELAFYTVQWLFSQETTSLSRLHTWLETLFWEARE